MSYTNIHPLVVSFETSNNNILLPHIKYAVLRTIFLTKEDIMKGKITIGSTEYLLFLSEDLYNIVFTCNNNINRRFTRIEVISSFQIQTNNSAVVLCKIIEPKNRRGLSFKKALILQELNSLFTKEKELLS